MYSMRKRNTQSTAESDGRAIPHSLTDPNPGATGVWLVFLIVFVVTVCSRLPFLDAGYGDDFDAWENIESAEMLANNTLDTYRAFGRPPTYPTLIRLYSFMWEASPPLLNFLTALFSGVACAFFGATLLRLGGSKPTSVLGGLALAFIPIIYINSVNTMDYLYALSFMMAGLYLAITGIPWAAGICAGLAIGFRITSGALLFPLALYFLMNAKSSASAGAGKWQRLKPAIIFSIAMLLAGGVSYLPVILRDPSFGWFRYTPGPFSKFARLIPYVMTKEIFGVLGCCGIAIMLAAGAITAIVKRRWCPGPGHSAGMWGLIGLAMVLYIGAFLRLPEEPSYLIPTVPFVLLALFGWLPRWAFTACCGILLLSPLLLDHIPAWQGKPRIALAGPVIQMHQKRVATWQSFGRVFETLASYPEDELYVVAPVSGRWMKVGPRLKQLQATRQIKIPNTPDPQVWRKELEAGKRIVFVLCHYHGLSLVGSLKKYDSGMLDTAVDLNLYWDLKKRRWMDVSSTSLDGVALLIKVGGKTDDLIEHLRTAQLWAPVRHLANGEMQLLTVTMNDRPMVPVYDSIQKRDCFAPYAGLSKDLDWIDFSGRQLIEIASQNKKGLSVNPGYQLAFPVNPVSK